MSRGINSYRFKVQSSGIKNWELDKREKLVQQLERLGVRVNKPYEMGIRQLEMLVKCHRKTVESRPDYISKEQVKVAEANGLTKEDVVSRVDGLNWEVEHAIKIKKVVETKEQRRARRKAELARMIEQLNAGEGQAK